MSNEVTRILKVRAELRYLSNASVNGVRDITDEEQEQGASPRMPCVTKTDDGWVWSLDIDVDTGMVMNWPKGNTADTYYKVCDCCKVDLVVFEGPRTKETAFKPYDGYVPDCLSPKAEGYGDYMIMEIDADGKIVHWDVSKANKFIEEVESGKYDGEDE